MLYLFAVYDNPKHPSSYVAISEMVMMRWVSVQHGENIMPRISRVPRVRYSCRPSWSFGASNCLQGQGTEPGGRFTDLMDPNSSFSSNVHRLRSKQKKT